MKSAFEFIRAKKIKIPVTDFVLLDLEGRQRRRFVLTSDGGEEFLVNLPKSEMLNEGDAFVLDDGCLIGVRAACEELLEIKPRDPLHLVRLAWHLGNRHLATEITADTLYIRDDHVIADMLRGLGAVVVKVERAFQPESGAYHSHGEKLQEAHSHGKNMPKKDGHGQNFEGKAAQGSPSHESHHHD